jgi:hypothetical protein
MPKLNGTSSRFSASLCVIVRAQKRIAALTISFALVFGSARADWRFDAETGAFYDSNLSRSDRAADEKDDWAWQSDVRLGYGFQLSRDLRLNVAGDLEGQVWDQFDAFDEVGGGGSASLRYRLGLGRKAPWILVENRLAYDRFRESVRSGWDEKLQIRGGMGITDRISIEAGYKFDNFAAPDHFFDLQGHSGGIRLIGDVTSSLQLALGYTYRDGDVISYAIPPRPDILLLTSERRPVNTFGSPPYTAYRLQGSTHTISISAGYALTKYISVQMAYAYAVTSRDPLEYENHLFEAKVAVAF